jgi:hypothetical protein
MTKAELLSWLREEQGRWEGLLDRVGEARTDDQGAAGSWSLKELVAHLTVWQRNLVARMSAAQRGEAAPAPPWPAELEAEDDINAWIYEANRGRSVREVLDDSQQMFRELFAAVEGLPDDTRFETVVVSGREFYTVWVGGERFAPGEFFYHFRDDHAPDVRAWLARGEKR